MADLTDRAPQYRARIMGVNQAIVGCSWVACPVLGGWLAELYGYHVSFAVSGVAAVVCSISYMQLSETLTMPNSASLRRDGVHLVKLVENAKLFMHDWFSNIRKLSQSRNQQALVVITCAYPLIYSCLNTTLAVHAVQALAAGPKELGFIFSMRALFQAALLPVGALAADKVGGTRKAIVACSGLVCALSLASSGFATSYSGLFVALGFQGISTAFLQPSVSAFMADTTKAEERGQAISLQRQISAIVHLAAPLCLCPLGDIAGHSVSIFTSSLLISACHAAYCWLAIEPQQ